MSTFYEITNDIKFEDLCKIPNLKVEHWDDEKECVSDKNTGSVRLIFVNDYVPDIFATVSLAGHKGLSNETYSTLYKKVTTYFFGYTEEKDNQLWVNSFCRYAGNDVRNVIKLIEEHCNTEFIAEGEYEKLEELYPKKFGRPYWDEEDEKEEETA